MAKAMRRFARRIVVRDLRKLAAWVRDSGKEGDPSLVPMIERLARDIEALGVRRRRACLADGVVDLAVERERRAQRQEGAEGQ